MCVENSARSQMAEGLAKHILSKDLTVYSAGSNPTTVNHIAIKVMQEINIDISAHYSKSYDDLPQQFKENIHLVITLCKEEICPILPKNVEYIHLPFDDPANSSYFTEEEQILYFRKIRDKLKEKILLIIQFDHNRFVVD